MWFRGPGKTASMRMRSTETKVEKIRAGKLGSASYSLSEFQISHMRKRILASFMGLVGKKKWRHMSFLQKIRYCIEVEMPHPRWLFGPFSEHFQWVTAFSSSFFHSRETWSHIINVPTLVSLDSLTDCYWNWWVPPRSEVDTQGCQELPSVHRSLLLSSLGIRPHGRGSRRKGGKGGWGQHSSQAFQLQPWASEVIFHVFSVSTRFNVS